MPVDIGNKTIRNPFVIPWFRKVNVDSNLNPNYSFENFIEGDCNRLARSAGFAVAEGYSLEEQLLIHLIYGGVGLGKTHLGHAIGISIKDQISKQNCTLRIVRKIHSSVYRFCQK